MLILTRCPGESVQIGKDVKFTVLRVKGNQVRIGIDAPKEVAIVRDDAIKKHKHDLETNNKDFSE